MSDARNTVTITVHIDPSDKSAEAIKAEIDAAMRRQVEVAFTKVMKDLDEVVPPEPSAAEWRVVEGEELAEMLGAERKEWFSARPCRTAPMAQEQLNTLRHDYFEHYRSKRLDLSAMRDVAKFGAALGVWPSASEGLLYLVERA